MSNGNINKRCFGYECKIRNRCAHYLQPINYAQHFFQPVEKGEDCHYFIERESWNDLVNAAGSLA